MRYLIRMCCVCHKELGRNPLPQGYGKFGIARLDAGDVISHLICNKCGPKTYGKLWEATKDKK